VPPVIAGDHARPLDIAGRDGVAQRSREIVDVARVAQRGEAGPQRQPGAREAADADHGHRHVEIDRDLGGLHLPGVVGAHLQVDVTIDQAGNDRLTGEIDAGGAQNLAKARVDGNNAAVGADRDVGRPGRAAGAVDQPGIRQDQRSRAHRDHPIGP
jgi:hypothetical protein